MGAYQYRQSWWSRWAWTVVIAAGLVAVGIVAVAALSGCVAVPQQWDPPLTPVEQSAAEYDRVQAFGERVGRQMKQYAEAGLLSPADAAEAERLYEQWADTMDAWEAMNLAVARGDLGAVLSQAVADAANEALTRWQETILRRARKEAQS